MGESEQESSALLRAACASGSLQDLQALVAIGHKLSLKDEWGRSLLHVAVENGRVEIADYLIHHGLDMCILDQFNESLLHVAARFSSFEMVQLLVKRGANVCSDRNASIQGQGEDPEDLLVLAVQHLSLEAVKFLLDAGCSVDVKHHSRLLRAVAGSGDLAMVEFFVAQGADISATDEYGNSMVCVAAKHGPVELVEYFIKKGLREDGDLLLRAAVEGDQLDVLKYLVAMRLNLHSTDRVGRTLLHTAVQRASLAMIKYLVKRNVDVFAITRDGHSLVHTAVARGDPSIIDYVLSLGFDVATVNSGGPSLLHLAVRSGNLDNVKLLVTKGLSFLEVDENGHTLLEVATWKNDLPMIQLLEERGLKLTNTGTPSLMRIAIEHASLEVIKYFVTRGLSIEETDKDLSFLAIDCDDGDILEDEYVRRILPEATAPVERRRYTFLHAAVQRGALSIVKFLVDQGLDVDAVDRQGRSLLHLATSGPVEVIQFLMERGADPTIEDRRSKTPVHFAVRQGRTDIIQVFMENAINIVEVDTKGPELMPLAVKSGAVDMTKLLASLGLASWGDEQTAKNLLVIAVENGDIPMVSYLSEGGLNPCTYPTLLHIAVEHQNPGMFKHLLERGLGVSAVNEQQDTLLHTGIRQLVAPGSVDLQQIKFLLGKSLDVNARGKWNETPLHVMCRAGDVDGARYLLDGGASAAMEDMNGNTPLHIAAHEWNLSLVRLLLSSGAEVKSKNKDGLMPLGMALSSVLPLDNRTLGHLYETARMLCKVGAAWSSDCEDMLLQWPQRMQNQLERQWSKTSSSGQESDIVAEIDNLLAEDFIDDRDVEPEYLHGLTIRLGIRVCVLHWTREHALGEPLSKVPFEVLRRGEKAVSTYLNALEATGTEELRYRHKVCMAGPTKWGKTSFVRSIVASRPKPAAEGDRTIGIDLGSFSFVEESPASVKCHDVTFWDFAGQDVYRVVHALFFSKQTLYLICVDLHAYATALQVDEQDRIDLPSREDESRVARFVSTSILSWIRLILSRQLDAELLVVGTKADKLADRSRLIREIQSDLSLRLHTWKRSLDSDLHHASDVRPSAQIDRLIARDWLIVSSIDHGAVQAARQRLEQLIGQSTSCFVMPAKYSRVLKAILSRRDAAARLLDGKERVKHLIVPVHALCKLLMREVESLVDVGECLSILHTLHDVGDILWYEEVDAGPLRDVVVLDPLLVIDLVREVVNHEQLEEAIVTQDGRVTHAQLMRCHLWKDLDRELVYAFKSLLQFFQVVYSSDNAVMDWDADLIVPSYWKTRREGMPGTPLFQQRSSMQRRGVGVSVHLCWDYDIPSEISETIFEQLAVESFTPLLQRTAWHRCIESFASGEFASRLELWPGHLSSDVIRVEVVADDSSTAWKFMRFYVMAMETVLDRYPGLLVSRHLVELKGTTETRYRISAIVKSMQDAVRLDQGLDAVRAALPWTPPDLAWFVDKAWRDPSVLHRLRMQELLQQSVDTMAVVRRLVVADEKARRFPALWTVAYQPDRNHLMSIRMLSDLSGVCFHAPIEIDVPPRFLAQYGEWIQSGVSLCANVISSVLSIGVVAKAIQAVSPQLAVHVEGAQRVHNLIDQLRLPATGGAYESTSRTLPPSMAVLLLRDLLQLHDGESFDELKVSLYTNLECAATAEGHFVWGHRHELLHLHGAMDLFDPGRFTTTTGTSPVPPPPRAPTSTLQLQLSIAQITGLSPWDWRRCLVQWRVLFGQSQTPLGMGHTREHADASTDPCWASDGCFQLPFVADVAMLRACRLQVHVQRPSRFLGKLKLIAEGSAWFQDFLPSGADKTFTCDPIKVVLGNTSTSINTGSTARVVMCRLTTIP